MNEGAIKLGRWMRRVDVTQKQAAERLEVNQSTISKWLAGVARPSHSTALVVERVSRVPWAAWWRDAASDVRKTA